VEEVLLHQAEVEVQAEEEEEDHRWLLLQIPQE
jgi:hypothetical protein